MIRIGKSATADTRTCDFANVTKETVLASSRQHIHDVRTALMFFEDLMERAGQVHDADKITDIDGFMANFRTGFKERDWLDRHYEKNRHHLNDRVPDDVNLIDVLDYIADNVMAGMGRSGEVRSMVLPFEVFNLAFQNTVALLTSQVVVEEPVTADAVGQGNS